MKLTFFLWSLATVTVPEEVACPERKLMEPVETLLALLRGCCTGTPLLNGPTCHTWFTVVLGGFMVANIIMSLLELVAVKLSTCSQFLCHSHGLAY